MDLALIILNLNLESFAFLSHIGRQATVLHHFFRKVIDHFGAIAEHFDVSGLQELFLLIAQRLPNGALHAQVIQGVLAGFLHAQEFKDVVSRYWNE